ncbi:MAG: PAS domain S-box protein [Candidatus Delongbacteria bacterium]|nr:PAS domain S-box protein [Candidatus Delongbacteria bacterium]
MLKEPMDSPKPSYQDLQNEISELENRLNQLSQFNVFELKEHYEELLHLYNELSVKEEHFKLLVENAPDGIYIQTDYRFSYLNNAALAIYGADHLDQLLDTPIIERVHPDDREIVMQRMADLNGASITVPRAEFRHLRLDGSVIEVEISAIPFQYQKKNGALVFARDVTARKIVENAIRQKNEFIQTIMDNLPIGLGLSRFNESKLTYMNKRYEAIYGWNSEILKNEEEFFSHVFPDEDYRAMIEKRIKSDVQSGNAERMRWDNIIICREDGEHRIVNAARIPMIEQDTMVFTVMDVSEQKNTEIQLIAAKEKAEESDRLKTAFLQNMSHEIRTPMNAIIGFSEMLGQADPTSDKRHQYTEIIIAGSKQLLAVVNNILAISTLETKQEKINFEPVSINAMLKDLELSFRTAAQDRNLALHLTLGLADSHDKFISDEIKLRQILTNLINNAIKFTHQGCIEIGYGLKTYEVEFYVKDTGIGIQPDLHAKIFERFRQADSSMSRQYGGTGLGLAISRGYVELLGGKVHLVSEPGQGSTFFFTVPYRPVLSHNRKTDSENLEPYKPKSILVCEDEEYNYLFIKELLSDRDLRLLHAKNGREAVEFCRVNAEISAVFMDLKMPIMNGYDATRMIKSFRPDLPIIAYTAYAMPQDLERADEFGFDGYLSKPIDPQHLHELVDRYLSNSAFSG